MKFFRDNMFVVTLVTVTIAVSAVLVWLGYSKSSDMEEVQMVDRDKVSGNLRKLARKPYENTKTIRNQQKRVDMVLTSLKKVQDMNLKFNSQYFAVPLLPTVGGAEVSALPYDEHTWNKLSLAFRYTQQYHRQIDNLLKRLNATTPPSPEEVNAEAQRQLDRLTYEQRIKEKKTVATKEAAAARPTGGPMVGGPMMAGPTGARGGTDADLKAQAQDKALNITRLRKAQRGVIYASESALDVKFLRGKMYTQMSPDQIWNAQVGLWVQRDVVKAISDTIDEVMKKRGLKGNQRNVMNSPVKKLVEFRLSESDKPSTTGTPTGGMMGGPGVGGPAYGGAANYGGSQRGRSRGRRGEEPEVVKANSLTQHSANKMCDVVNYRFTVLMPTRYLAVLERNLLKQNYHIILNENIEPADVADSTAKPGRTGRQEDVDETSLYYYGTEPVSRVTIEGQLLLLTSWTRGTWDSENRKWIRLPLMPIEVMQTLPPAALRLEDQDLLKQAARLKANEQLDDNLPSLPWVKAAGSGSSR